MGKRAARRRKGQRKEDEKKAAKLLAREQGKMWRKLSTTPKPKEDEIILGYQGNVAWQTASYYAPYMPIIQNSGIIGDCTA